MNAKELIASGIIELYCLDIASEEERSLVEQLAQNDPMVTEEITSVKDALAQYAVASTSLHAPGGLKEKILSSIQSGVLDAVDSDLPPVLTPQSTVEEWLHYLEQQHIEEPSAYDGLIFIELPGTEDFYTYAVFGKEGAIVEEETHFGHDEYLLICTGECEMTIGGEKIKYKAGDFLEIKPGIPHSAIITGKERMIVIGQRRAA